MPQASPSVNNLSIGKGVMYAATYSTLGALGAYQDLGEMPSIELEIQEETLDYLSNRSGVSEIVKQTTKTKGYSVKFKLDELTIKNLTMYSRGTAIGNKTIHGLTTAGLAQEYALKFVEDNPEGPNYTWYFHRTKIKSDGSMAVISEDWRGVPLIATGLRDTINNNAYPWYKLEASVTTTTTTSSSTTTTTA